MNRYYYIKRKKRTALPAERESSDRPDDSIILFREEASVDQNVTILSLIGWLFRSLSLLFLVVAFLLGGTILQKGGAAVREDLETRVKAAQAGLEDGLKAVSRGALDDALINFKLAQANLRYSSEVFYGLGQGLVLSAGLPYYLYGTAAKGQMLLAVSDLVEGGVIALTAGQEIQTMINSGALIFSAQSQKPAESLKEFSRFQQEIVSAAGLVESGRARLSLLSRVRDGEIKRYLETLTPKAALASAVLSVGERLMGGLPDVFGFGGARSYLLLFQNSNELRPTGGFIGTLGLLKIKNGGIESLSVEDVYPRDERLKGFDLEPPAPLRAVTSTFGIRDANFNPDFPMSVKTIRELYEKAGGGSVDGVIALTPRVLEDLLRLTGPIYLTSRNVVLSADNVATLLENSDPERGKIGLPNPGKELIREATPLLLARLLNGSAELRAKLGKLFVDYLREREILLALDNPKIASVLSEFRFDGALQGKAVSGDYLYINRANLGGRKSSRNLVSQIDYLATVQNDGRMQALINLNFRHQGSYVFPDGSNRDFLRLYVPLGSRLLGISGQDKNEPPDEGLENNMTVFSFWLTTEPGQTRTVSISYELPFKLDFRRGLANYKLYLEKQPGLRNASLTARLQLPKDWVAYAEDPFSWEGGTLTLYSGPFREDIERVITLER